MWGVLEVGMCVSLPSLHLSSTRVSSQVCQTPVPVLRRGESHLYHCCKSCRHLELIGVCLLELEMQPASESIVPQTLTASLHESGLYLVCWHASLSY